MLFVSWINSMNYYNLFAHNGETTFVTLLNHQGWEVTLAGLTKLSITSMCTYIIHAGIWSAIHLYTKLRELCYSNILNELSQKATYCIVFIVVLYNFYITTWMLLQLCHVYTSVTSSHLSISETNICSSCLVTVGDSELMHLLRCQWSQQADMQLPVDQVNRNYLEHCVAALA